MMLVSVSEEILKELLYLASMPEQSKILLKGIENWMMGTENPMV